MTSGAFGEAVRERESGDRSAKAHEVEQKTLLALAFTTQDLN